ncbi:ribose-phosphate pyrophosphokinase [Sphingomonas sp. BIUV-7]|uniref:Ribose-phosphate pyrophosphokinase n=1 Tax=Sphingomonas natans TaxID=3063330 RepID=A0ABT8Y485_9SPHN|nr:ribose-phosphate pyrophosphokinase [Sphingomonas sp. BIUV-7]MDO6413119.1 ribose-phosphate pyrophosphokinase [Sphingomonas sp. BIUV-7]
MAIETLSEWLEAEGIVPVEGPGAIADVALVRSLLVAAAKRGEALSYSEILNALGFRFTRPKMRALCKTLDVIDREAALRGEPELAVLVVRESDRLPGQGWWTGASETRGYKGAWTGPEASAFVRTLQQEAFAYWAKAIDRP